MAEAKDIILQPKICEEVEPMVQSSRLEKRPLTLVLLLESQCLESECRPHSMSTSEFDPSPEPGTVMPKMIPSKFAQILT